MKEKNSESKALEAAELQLPLERLTMPLGSFQIVDDTYCSSCEFVINYIRQNVRNLKNMVNKFIFAMKYRLLYKFINNFFFIYIQEEVKVVLHEVKGSLPGIKDHSNEENFLSKYEAAIAELIREGKDLSEVNKLNK